MTRKHVSTDSGVWYSWLTAGLAASAIIGPVLWRSLGAKRRRTRLMPELVAAARARVAAGDATVFPAGTSADAMVERILADAGGGLDTAQRVDARATRLHQRA
jgi:hypothetical protein